MSEIFKYTLEPILMVILYIIIVFMLTLCEIVLFVVLYSAFGVIKFITTFLIRIIVKAKKKFGV